MGDLIEGADHLQFLVECSNTASDERRLREHDLYAVAHGSGSHLMPNLAAALPFDSE